MKQLIAIDGNSLMHRAYYALPNMTATDGFPTGALHGFLSMLLKLVEKKPDYLVAAFDMPGGTFRHAIYAEYKAGRKETPEDLKTQFPVLKELLVQMGIAVCECQNYEADDILGTFSRLCGKADVSALLVTGDRDALQLIDAHTHVLMTKKGITDTVEFDEQTLLEAYGLSPDHMRDLKGLMGDASDHIPGVPGVGEKTALKLLGEYGTIENVLAHAGEVKGKLGEKLLENADSARMSYQLGTICTEAPITMGIEDCALDVATLRGGKGRLSELELRSIVSRLPAGEGSVTVEPPQDTLRINTVSIQSSEELCGLAELAAHAEALAVALGDMLEFAFDGATCYRVEGGGDLFSPGIDPSEVFTLLKPLLEDPEKRLLVFDIKRLRHAAGRYGISVNARVFDAMIADYLLNAIRPAGSLEILLEQRLHTEKGNAAMLFALERPMLDAISKADMDSLYQGMELPLSTVLYEMETEGFLVDGAILRELQGQFKTRSEELEQAVYREAGETFNILSPKQLGGILFDKLGLPAKKKTKSGYSTDADTLEALADANPIVPMVLEYRFLTKLKSTFVDGLLNMQGPDGRVHTSLNQCVTATGRISSTEPNLQNIPVRTELGREIRKAFVASPGNVLVGADYSQIELRLLAHISGDQGMIAAFNNGLDIHRATASEVFGVPPEDVTSDMRSAAKAVNFGIVYGISDFGLARNLGIPVRQASEYIKLYFSRYPGVKAYLDSSVTMAKEAGYAKTLFNRRRALPELTSGNFNTRSFGERVAMNMPIQGTAADIIKLAMVHAAAALEKNRLQSKLILQVHDELIFDTPSGETEAVMEMVKACMENVVQLSVPLLAEVKTGHSWYDTK